MAPKPKHQLAREHLERALPGVASSDYTEAVTWLFASLEAAVASLAEPHGTSLQPKHWHKVEVARKLHSRGHAPEDLAPTLNLLNEARKEAVYEGEEPDLRGESLEDLVGRVEAAVKLAEAEAR